MYFEPVAYITNTSFYREQEDYVSLSFTTISSTGADGAIIHYK